MTSSRRRVGVLGGMGPDATLDFMQKVIALTPATVDQDHLHMLIDHNPAVPNRQDAILAGGADPGPALAAMAARLQAAGAEFLVMPCNTAEAFAAAVRAGATIPLLSIVDVTVAAAAKLQVDSVGLLATDGCLESGIYQRALDGAGIAAVLPEAAELRELMRLIAAIKAGDRGEPVEAAMAALATCLLERGAAAIIAGCTEIPLVLDAGRLPVPLIASTDELAKRTVAIATGAEALP